MALSTVDPHPHVITGECPVPCLKGIVRASAVRALRIELSDSSHPYGTVAKVAEMFRDSRLQDVRGIGVKAVTEIRDALEKASLL